MELIITSKEDLRSLIAEAVESALVGQSNRKMANEESSFEKKKLLNLEETLVVLSTMGHFTTSKSIYNLVSKGKFPYKKINGKLVFDRTLVENWAKRKMKIA